MTPPSIDGHGPAADHDRHDGLDGHDHDGHDHDGHDGHSANGGPPDAAWQRRIESMGADDLRSLTLSLPVLEQAKGILMGHYGCDATTAFAVLRQMSSVRHLKLREVAASLVDSVSHSDGHDGHDGASFSGVSRFLRAMGDGHRPG